MNDFNTIDILRLPFINTTKDDILERIIKPSMSQEQQLFIVTANPEIALHANEDKKYASIINQADYVIPDGIGIIIASKIIKKPLSERIPGIELFEEMLKLANDNQKSVYFFGAKDEVISKAVKNIKEEYPNLTIAGYHHGYVDLNNETIINEISKTQPDFIFVALGFPKQEEWIYKNKGKIKKGIFMGVGGSFDVKAGVVKRAPMLWQKLHLEWLYRLILNPIRFKRVLKLPHFLVKVLRGK